jgi:general secretion pathway protein G
LVAALAMICMLVIPRIVGRSEQAHISDGLESMSTDIKVRLDAFQVDNGFYPRSLQDLITPPKNARNWHGPYVDKLPVDPWGHKYIYECPGKHNTNGYDLFSAGPDGNAGTEDDIGSWMN